MDTLIDESWRIYVRSTHEDIVVRPSIPILFFGDSERYGRSPLKVITVALNPSRREFPTQNRFERFPVASAIDAHRIDADARNRYLRALNEYFRTAPYRGWFGWFEEVLRGLGTSYYEHETSTALHTDLCSPLATDPTWSLLGTERARLETDGIALWHRLVTVLSPDVIVISVAKRYRDRVAFADSAAWSPCVTLPRSEKGKRPYVAWAQTSQLGDGSPTHLLYGQAAQQPFATLDKARRRQVGRAFLEYLGGR